MPVDAIPDIGEKQVIVFADWPGRSPAGCGRSGHLSAHHEPHRHAGREVHPLMSGFGFSMVFVIFKDTWTTTGRAHACSSA
jgi:Cu(I)/Ag(I) efflux system membrane protein CusA/SilA